MTEYKDDNKTDADYALDRYKENVARLIGEEKTAEMYSKVHANCYFSIVGNLDNIARLKKLINDYEAKTTKEKVI